MKIRTHGKIISVSNRYLCYLFFLAAIFTACALGDSSNKPKPLGLFIEKQIAAGVSAAPYTIFFPAQSNNIKFTLTRPSRDDKNILLAVPGTYTSPQDTVEGYVILDGKIIQQNERQGWDGAALFTKSLGVKILQTRSGRDLTKDRMWSWADQGYSLIQAHLLVKDGKPQSFKPQPPSQRRALAKRQDGRITIIESTGPLDLTAFAKDLVDLGVLDAVNLDMGRWSEGWYRDPLSGKPVTIGTPNEMTAHQTNWIIFEAGPDSTATLPESPPSLPE